MDFPSDWPQPLVAVLRTSFGDLVAVKSNDGMSGASVWRVSFAATDVIVKASKRDRESRFYRDVAPVLRERGVGIPRVYAATSEVGRHWLAMECLGQLGWPESGVPPDEVLANLVRLHTATRYADFVIDRQQFGAWLPGRTERALTWFDEGVAGRLREPLAALEAHARRLLQSLCWISGDPSPPNWGLSNGAPALFDWELFRPGVPATDLAITIAGFPSTAAMRDVARRYLSLAGESPSLAEEMARDMAVAKVGTVVVMLAGQVDGNANVPPATIERIVAGFPGWVAELRAAVT